MLQTHCFLIFLLLSFQQMTKNQLETSPQWKIEEVKRSKISKRTTKYSKLSNYILWICKLRAKPQFEKSSYKCKHLPKDCETVPVTIRLFFNKTQKQAKRITPRHLSVFAQFTIQYFPSKSGWRNSHFTPLHIP